MKVDRITYVSAADELGGGERSLLDLLASARDMRPSADLTLICGGEGGLSKKAAEMGIRTVSLPLPAVIAGVGDSALKYSGSLGAAWSMAWRAAPAGIAVTRHLTRLRRALRGADPGVIHSNDIKSHVFSALAAPAGSRVVWHIRDFLRTRPLVSRALAGVSGRTSGVIAISEAVRLDVCGALAGLPIEVVHNAIDLSDFSPGAGDASLLDELSKMAPAESGTVRVGLVATFGRWKGHDLFLEAIAALRAQGDIHRPVRFYIVGGPIYRTRGSQVSEDQLREKSARLGIAGELGFIGYQGEPARIYRALDIVVHASTEPEPFGRTIVEAMACGKAVIVSSAGGAAELYSQDVDAIGFSPGDRAGLVAAIRSLVENPDHRDRLGIRARQSAEARFSRERLGPQVAVAYERFAAARRRE